MGVLIMVIMSFNHINLMHHAVFLTSNHHSDQLPLDLDKKGDYSSRNFASSTSMPIMVKSQFVTFANRLCEIHQR